MTDIQVLLGELESLSRKVESGTDSLDAMEPAPVANAGESLAIVAEAIGRFAQVSAGVSGGLHQSADDVRAARDVYARADRDGAGDLHGIGGN